MLRTRSFGWRGCGIWRHRISELVLARRRTDMVLRPGTMAIEHTAKTNGVVDCWELRALHIGRCGGGAAAGAVRWIEHTPLPEARQSVVIT